MHANLRWWLPYRFLAGLHFWYPIFFLYFLARLDDAMESAQRQGRLRLLAHGEQVGYSIFETPDQRQLMHLGHPEYNVGRIL